MAGQEKQHWIRYAPWAALVLLGLAAVWVLGQQPWARRATAAARQAGSAPSNRGMSLIAAEAATQSRPSLDSTGTATVTPSLPTPTPTPAGPTPIPTRTEVIVYKVKEGDNVWDIAKSFNIDQDTIIWANTGLETDPDWLSIGQELFILPIVGVEHTVKAGDTLESLGKYYKVDPRDIASYEPNQLTPGTDLPEGKKLIIPGGVKPYAPKTVDTGSGTVTISRDASSTGFIWPCNGTITTEYSAAHQAIDIGIDIDTPLYATAAGVVTQSGPNGTLGLSVTVDHGNGYVTVYGHMDYLWVRPGQNVRQGQKIGAVGSTGKSTGPHVHFIILHWGTPADPMSLLPH
jgi:murein DD-endopeptidase MepM/ murein hydrolase activator NlpD